MDYATEAERKAAQQARLEQELADKLSPMILTLAEQARAENPGTISFEQLRSLSSDPAVPAMTQGQAALQYARLLFDFERPDAFTTSEKLVKQWHSHPDAASAHHFLANQWIELSYYEEAMDILIQTLTLPLITEAEINTSIAIAEQLLNHISKQSSIDWLLAISRHDHENRSQWLQQAAKLSSLEDALQLRQSDHPLTVDQSDFYRYLARQRLMVGDYHAVRVIAKILQSDMPDSEALDIVMEWSESKQKPSSIGVLLPLSGKYKKFGLQALEGIRLALNQPEFIESVTLHIIDTAGDQSKTIQGYQQLIKEKRVDWVVGPLLSENTQALIPHLKESVPVISLSSQVELASESPNLFIHSLAKTVQADFMAQYAIRQDKKRMLIIFESSDSAREEAAAFSQTYMDLGGEVIDAIELSDETSDHRPELVEMRSRTDNEELLAELEEDLMLFSPEVDMDIKLPLEFDGIYIAASGKTLSVLAGQMAYSDINKISLYGSFRWNDNHLMDDKGRYLDKAQFSTPLTSLTHPDQAILDVQNQYRVIWADNHRISPLFALAYDAAISIASLGTRLGLKDDDAIDALNHTDFYGISGNYYFDAKGISQKNFAIQTIRRGKIETVQNAR